MSYQFAVSNKSYRDVSLSRIKPSSLYSPARHFAWAFLGLVLLSRAAISEERKSTLYQLYQNISHTFWDAEHQLQQRVDPFSGGLGPYTSPLSKSDPLYQKYFSVDQAANEYLTFSDSQPQQSWTLPPVLYLGGIAAFTIGDYANAQKYFSWLLQNHADYQRYSYIGDDYAPDPDFAQPIKPGVTKLLFYCQIVGGRGGAPASDAFAGFQQFNQTTLKVLSTQTEFANWLSHRANKFQRRIFLNEDYGGDEPDQLRASALPQTGQLIEDGWRNLFPAALKKSGALKMREYLRTLATEDSSLRDVAAPRLAEVDQLVIKSYFAEAKALLAKKDFAGTRAKYKQIMVEYPIATHRVLPKRNCQR
jgi:hypothetical protein